jgi:hypothetical protein
VEKILRVKFSNGDEFSIPTRIIAENRANYYSEVDGYEKESNEWEQEVQYAMNDEYEIEDWAANNMNWDELEPFATLLDKSEEFDYEDEWGEADKKVVIDEN